MKREGGERRGGKRQTDRETQKEYSKDRQDQPKFCNAATVIYIPTKMS